MKTDIRNKFLEIKKMGKIEKYNNSRNEKNKK